MYEDFSDLREADSGELSNPENAELLQQAAAKFTAKIRPNYLNLKSFAKLAVHQRRLKNDIARQNSTTDFSVLENSKSEMKLSKINLAYQPEIIETVEADKNQTVSKLIN